LDAYERGQRGRKWIGVGDPINPIIHLQEIFVYLDTPVVAINLV
jgi:hypothetical protein